MAKRISIINFKGGVGKTALSLNFATGLSHYHEKKVLLVDVDHQSTLSVVCLGGKRWDNIVNEGKTIDTIFQHFTNQNIPLPGKEIIFYKPYKKFYPRLDLLPAALILDETELELSSTTVGNPIESEWNKRTLLCKWIQANNIDEEYDYIIFDCPPATKLVTQNAVAVSHGYIIPAIPDAVSTRGIPHLINRVFNKIDSKFNGLANYLHSNGTSISKIYVPKTKLVGIVISKIKTSGNANSGYTNDHTQHLSSITKMYPVDTVKPYIVEGVGVPECLSNGYPVYNYYDHQNVKKRDFINIFKKVTTELKKRIDVL
ncbi:MAG: hypothetical protein APF84_06755 [Gracilibacter sp. BRH_c7a]|nr:MAG: hypothetical protein APF84_06755 [Gracilibacter sp. BRH_c7a]